MTLFRTFIELSKVLFLCKNRNIKRLEVTMSYQPINYQYQQPMPNPYADRLAQLQNSYQQAMNVAPVQPQINQGLLWVSGEVGAKSYLVAPNSTVLLMDSDAQRFYLKSADGAGMPSMRVFEYSEIANTPQTVTQLPNLNEKDFKDRFVTREEYEGLNQKYEAIMQRLNNITAAEQEVVAKPNKPKRGGTTNESDI